MPNRIATLKLNNTGPPNSSGITDRAVAADTKVVRVAIWLVERLIMSTSDMRLYLRRFSRMRSNTTTVSLIE